MSHLYDYASTGFEHLIIVKYSSKYLIFRKNRCITFILKLPYNTFKQQASLAMSLIPGKQVENYDNNYNYFINIANSRYGIIKLRML